MRIIRTCITVTFFVSFGVALWSLVLSTLSLFWPDSWWFTSLSLMCLVWGLVGAIGCGLLLGVLPDRR